jgi:hypothetical protein
MGAGDMARGRWAEAGTEESGRQSRWRHWGEECQFNAPDSDIERF